MPRVKVSTRVVGVLELAEQLRDNLQKLPEAMRQGVQGLVIASLGARAGRRRGRKPGRRRGRPRTGAGRKRRGKAAEAAE